MKVGIVGTDLAPLDAKVGALEKLCLGWASQLEGNGFQVYLFSIPPSPQGTHRLIHFDDPEDLDAKLQQAQLDTVIVNNRPLWRAGDITRRINIFHNYPDAWMAEIGQELENQMSTAINLAVSGALAKEINRSLPMARTRALYPFIDQAILDSGPSFDHGDKEGSSDKIRVLFPNRTLEKKGLRWLLDTIDGYLANKVSLTVIRNISPWISETQEHKDLLNLARSRSYVTIRDKVLDTDGLVELYRSHDVVVTPSMLPEGLGLIPLEAQALGVPVVASELGGLKESVLTPNLTVEVGSKEQLADAIVEASRSSAVERQRTAKLVAERFSMTASTNQLAKELLRLLDGHGFC